MYCFWVEGAFAYLLYFGDIGILIFGPPRSGWDLWFSLRSSIRSFVRPSIRLERSLKWLIGLFWFLAQSCNLIMWRKWRFCFLKKNLNPGDYRGLVSKLSFLGHNLKTIRFRWNLVKSCRIWFVIFCYKWVHLEKSRSQDNPLNPLENNRIKKTKGSRA